MKYVSILGVTGSIGTQTLEVIRNESENFKLLGISSNGNGDKIISIINEFNPKFVSINDESEKLKVENYIKNNNLDIELYTGLEGNIKIATISEVDIVVTSIVGRIGLVPTIEAIKAKKDIALANKETLVVAGELVMKLAKENSVNIFPVDSEHSAIFQCLQGNENNSVSKIIITASGGPFRNKSYEELKNVTVEDALKHPTWAMGKKITIDSSTLMNKGLEVIEAHYLFNMEPENIEVIVHPQSIIHSMVEYIDGSVIAQLGNPSMILPIQYALNYPKREKRIVEKLDLVKIKSLTFEKPNMDNFKCLKHAFDALKCGYLMPAIINGANEKLVELFLKRRIKFLQIGEIIQECMDKFDYKKDVTLENVLTIDDEVRRYVEDKYK